MSTRGSTAEQSRERSPFFARRAAEWERSAVDDDRVVAILDQLPSGYVVFHDLGLPKPSTATVGHLVVSPLGIWVINIHHYTDPVTHGRGRNSDTLWSGRAPLRSALEALDWAAEQVGQLIGRRVEPLMCVIAPSMPEPSFEFNGIAICAPDQLSTPLLTPTGEPVDTPAAVETVRRVFGAEPAPVAEPPTLVPAVIDRTEIAPYPARRVTFGARIHAIRRSVAFRVIVLVALGAGATAFFPTALGTWDSVGDGVNSIRSGVTGGGSDDAPAQDPAPEAPRPVRFVATCPAPGAGWELQWVWPGDLPAGAAAYGIRVETPDAEIRLVIAQWDDPTEVQPALRVDGDEPLTILTDHLDGTGSIVTTTRQPVATFGDTC